jgi:hypothetical protein
MVGGTGMVGGGEAKCVRDEETERRRVQVHIRSKARLPRTRGVSCTGLARCPGQKPRKSSRRGRGQERQREKKHNPERIRARVA